MVLRIYVENSKLFVCVSDAFFRQPRLMGYFFTFSTLEGPTNAYYFVLLKVFLIYFGNLRHEKGFGFQSLKGEILHSSSWSFSIFLCELCGPLHLCWLLSVGPFNTWLISSGEKITVPTSEQLTKWQLFSLIMTTLTILSEIDVILCICSACDNIFFSQGQHPKTNTDIEDL